ncbi:MAG: histidine kinase dimerization/phospho-acceptor domain-containing protein [bacterium]|nr:histidine kinase dimerization/phospho-acceptor domain-containing protein [bacterium]
MNDELNIQAEAIVGCALALLNENNGSLSFKQREVVKTILANAEQLIHLYAAFQSVPPEKVSASLRHELGNPLTPILGYSDLLAMGAIGLLSDIQRGYVQLICDSTEQLRALIEQRVAEARRCAALAS